MGSLREHRELRRYVFNRLKQKPHESLACNLEYFVNDLQGELDIQKYRNGVHTYYEIKSSHGPKQWKKARHQFERCNRAFPDLQWNFVYVAPGCVRRYRC